MWSCTLRSCLQLYSNKRLKLRLWAARWANLCSTKPLKEKYINSPAAEWWAKLNTGQIFQRIETLSVLKETCFESHSLACVEVTTTRRGEGGVINPYRTCSSPNTGCSYSFSSEHLATWEGGDGEDGWGKRKKGRGGSHNVKKKITW